MSLGELLKVLASGPDDGNNLRIERAA